MTQIKEPIERMQKTKGFLIILKVDEWAVTPKEAAYFAMRDIFRLYDGDEDGCEVLVIPHNPRSRKEYTIKVKFENERKVIGNL